MKQHKALMIVFGVLVAVKNAPSCNVTPEMSLSQGKSWTCEQRIDFWHIDQGSMIMPLDLFLRLKDAHGKPFSAGLERYGLIPDPQPVQTTKRTQSIPVPYIGMAVHPDDTGLNWVGLTCSACHAGLLRYQGKSFIIEGAQSSFDFESFFGDAVDAVQRSEEKGLFSGLAERMQYRKKFNQTDVRAGFGRVDAFGQIFNQVSMVLLRNDIDARIVPRAPASYPFLWDIAQHTRVQWNGSAPNLGIGGDGSVLRNVGEVIGVFATTYMPTQPDDKHGYRSSVELNNLKVLEAWVSQLNSPEWPGFFGNLPGKSGEGKKLYDANCAQCHTVLDRSVVYKSDDAFRKYDAGEKFTPVRCDKDHSVCVGTDPTQVDEFAGRVNTRNLNGVKELLYPRSPFRKFQQTDSIADVTTYVTTKVVQSRGVSAWQSIKDFLIVAWAGDMDLNVYKARPLNGVWTSAPYLHNGSIPNMAEMLTAAKNRKSSFCLGNLDFDPVSLGYAVNDGQCAEGQFRFDTKVTGNSNAGHEYGTNLNDGQKHDLIAYIRTL